MRSIFILCLLFIVSNEHPIQILSTNTLFENIESQSDKFEGDIILTLEQSNALRGINARTGQINEKYRWKNNTVPYTLDSIFSTVQRSHILSGLADIERLTCIKFVPNDNTHEDYVEITGANTGCWSSIGRNGGAQILNLASNDINKGCFRFGTIIHEFIHALGFYHMQSAAERDDYVKIIWDNIQPGMEGNFLKYDESTITQFDIPYDYASVMHYTETAFTKNGNKTIITIDPSAKIGQRVGMSKKDVARLNAMYCKKI